MKKIFTFIVACICIMPGFLSAQDNKSFHAVGSTAFLDYFQSPVTTYTDPTIVDFNTGIPITQYSYQAAYSLLTMMYRYRYNVYEGDDNFAIGVSITPAAGLSIAIGDNSAGFGHFNIPLMVEAEFGAGATYNTTGNYGGYVGAGFEANYAPIFAAELGAQKIDKFWMTPVISAGVRFWNSKNKLKEVNIKYGFGSSYPYRSSNSGTTTLEKVSAMSIRLGFVKFLNY